MIEKDFDKEEYLKIRLSELGISSEQNTFLRTWAQDSSSKDDNGNITTQNYLHTKEYKFFHHDDHGNITIHYFNQEGQPYRWKKEDTKQSRDYVRTRLRDPEAPFKYLQEKGSPHFPFFNPGIINKFKKCKDSVNIDGTAVDPIETLFIVEGEFKSFKGYLSGLDIIGIPSIHGFYDSEVKRKLHEDIQDVIITCQVKKIVFLVDADLLTVKWEQDKDLYLRPSSFYGAIKAFRESLQFLLENDKIPLQLCYMMHINTKFAVEAKGLDDLLSKYEALNKEILADLLELNFAQKYFTGFSILDHSKDVQGRIFRYLGMTDEQEFYKTYQEYIGVREFKFRRRRYVYDNEKREVVFVRHEDADKFMRIGPDWVKQITKLNKYGEEEQEIVRWSIAEIHRDYKKFPDFQEQIPKYDDFCNEPDWSDKYQRVIKGSYNLVEPLKWESKPGKIPITIKFLKHIFQGNGNVILSTDGQLENEEYITGDPFTVALDYLSILLTHPKHMLPVPILVSQENGTGKSTFLKWLQLMFGANMCILGNEQFKMKFNGHYISKFIIAIDEGFLEIDKKSEKERLKQLVTADSAYLENKGMNVRKINYYGKVIICSNDADRVMKIDEGESRWFVVKVPQIQKIQLTGKEMIDRGYKSYKGQVIQDDLTYEVLDADPDLEVKLKEELPAIIHFLKTRAIHHPRVNRLWFDPDWFITEQFKLIVETTKSRIDRVFEEWMRDQFLSYPSHDTLEFTLKYLTEQLNDSRVSKYKIDSVDVKNYLKSKGLVPAKDVRWHRVPVGFSGNGIIDEKGILIDPDRPLEKHPHQIEYRGLSGRPYTFKRADWIDAEKLLGDFVRNSSPLDQPHEKEQSSKLAQNDDLPF